MQVIMFIVHHTVRTLWSFFIGMIYAVAYWLISRNNSTYKENRQKWNNIKSLDDLVLFFQSEYKYKWDGIQGICDHDNTSWEFLIDYGDCDDVARFAAKKLRKLGYKAYRVGIFCFKNWAWHYDCMFVDKDGLYHLFNYGNILSGKTKDDCFSIFSQTWKNYPKSDTVNWRCFW